MQPGSSPHLRPNDDGRRNLIDDSQCMIGPGRAGRARVGRSSNRTTYCLLRLNFLCRPCRRTARIEYANEAQCIKIQIHLKDRRSGHTKVRRWNTIFDKREFPNALEKVHGRHRIE